MTTMKPFDIDLARQGHLVCYRNGTEPDEIHILPDWVDTIEPIITRYGEDQHYHRISGRFLLREDSDRDLFMKTETKIRWINICETKPIPIIYETEE